MKLKTIFILAGAVLLTACASAQKQDEEQTQERVVKQDKVVAEQARLNDKLYKQSAARMYKTRQLPAITYEFDSIRPPEYAYPFLDKVAEIMKAHENLHLVVEGHADIVGNDDYNYWISSSRAAAMKSYLVSRGVQADRIHVYGYGADRPLTLDTSFAGRKTNRRVEFKFTTREWNAIY